MHEFEIRILKADQQPSLFVPGPLSCVTAALQMARVLAAQGHIVEVWRDGERVHQERA